MIIINEPFWTAGRKYNWSGNWKGIGIRWSDLEGEGELKVRVLQFPRKKEFTDFLIDKKTAREFVERTNSFDEVKGVKLGVLQLESLSQTKPFDF